MYVCTYICTYVCISVCVESTVMYVIKMIVKQSMVKYRPVDQTYQQLLYVILILAAIIQKK